MKIILEVVREENPYARFPIISQWKGNLTCGGLTSYALGFTPQECLDKLMSVYVMEKSK